MIELVADFVSMLSGNPIIAGLALLTLLAFAAVVILLVSSRSNIPARRILIICLAVGIPFMIPMMTQSQKSFFAMNMSLADLVIIPAFITIFYGLLKRNKPIELPLFWLFLAYFLWGMISLYIGCHKLNIDFVSTSNIVNLAKFIALFVFFFLVVNLVEDIEDLKAFLKGWVITAFFVALSGIVGALLFILFRIDTFAAGQFRASGFTGNPNMFGGYIATSFFMTYVHLALGARKGPCFLMMATHVLALVLSASKGSLTGFIGGYAIMCLFIPDLRKKIIAIAAAATVVAVAAYSISENARIYLDRLISVTDFESQSYDIRFRLWESSLEIWEENYLCGVGRGNFSKAQPEQLEEEMTGKNKWDNMGIAPDERGYAVSHSTYLSLLCEMGIPGLIGFLAILLYFVWTLLRRILTLDSSGNPYKIQVSFLAALFCVFVRGGAANIENSRALWAFLGIMLVYEIKILRKQAVHS